MELFIIVIIFVLLLFIAYTPVIFGDHDAFEFFAIIEAITIPLFLFIIFLVKYLDDHYF